MAALTVVPWYNGKFSHLPQEGITAHMDTPSVEETPTVVSSSSSSSQSSSRSSSSRSRSSADEDRDSDDGVIIVDPETSKNYDDGLDQYTDDDNPDTPQVSWILSYGGSGTSYTIVNVEQLTNATTASNYGGDYVPCLPIRDDWPDGPFVRSPEKPFPPKYILTKSHCGGYCMDCGPKVYLHTPETFETACRTARKRLPNSTNTVHVTYDRNIPVRAIHLIRNPFDNLVGRMHLATKHHNKRVADNTEEDDDNDIYNNFTNTVTGIEEWCQYLDEKYATEDALARHPEQPEQLLYEQYLDVPCHAEWYRYIQWHNLAYETTQHRLRLPVHYLYFDNYTNHYVETVDQVLDFLQAPARNPTPYPFVAGKTYSQMFTAEHAAAATNMVRELASPAVWDLLKHYFQDWLL